MEAMGILERGQEGVLRESKKMLKEQMRKHKDNFPYLS